MEGKRRLSPVRYRSFTLRRLRRFAAVRLLVLLLLIWDSLYTVSIYREQAVALAAPPPTDNTRRIYIAAQHWNSGRLLRSHWNRALHELVQRLGTENVFVSIYESGSFDDTKDALRELDAALGALNVQRDIRLSHASHADEMEREPAGQHQGWVRTPSGTMMPRRIPFLARVRNAVFESLEARTAQGEVYDTVLFLNDVVFSSDDALRLLDTNGGDYAAACALDYAAPPYFYDTFAVRDTSGDEALMQTWPWFRSRASRHAAERLQPVPVASCWNGMVAMPASPFISPRPLRFRALPDTLAASHLEASECCLIHADNPLSATHPVLLNPLVRVAYNGSAYDAATAPSAALSLSQLWAARWKNRLLRWTMTTALQKHVVRARIAAWARNADANAGTSTSAGADGSGRVETGAFCAVDEMQVLYERGWRHV